VIEVEVHQQLRAFLRLSASPSWPHQLTMARLVARAMRLGRSALIQTGRPLYQGQPYRVSYLVPLLMWPGPAIWVGPQEVLQQLQMVEIPQLQETLALSWVKSVVVGDRWPHADFSGIVLTTPEQFFGDHLHPHTPGERFPLGIPTLIDGVDDLENWTRQQVNQCLTPKDWSDLMLASPQHRDPIRDIQVKLTKSIFQHPPNPYECYLLTEEDREAIAQLFDYFDEYQLILPSPWQHFILPSSPEEHLLWADIHRSTGQFTLWSGPIDIAPILAPLWADRPVVLIGQTLDREPNATRYCAQMGLQDLTCIEFNASGNQDLIHLYLPDRLPLPNTPQFQTQVLTEIQGLLSMRGNPGNLTVILVADVPLKAQIAATLAGEFGSKVQVEKTSLESHGILVCGWEFWRSYQSLLPTPGLLIIVALPIPSLEHPLVAGRVAYYKQRRLDWFREYLLPTAIQNLKRAIAPVRPGVVALLDTRVLHRSYGKTILTSLEPIARINYRDPTWVREIWDQQP
jgi:ATP-dependent DNA helicase DinG